MWLNHLFQQKHHHHRHIPDICHFFTQPEFEAKKFHMWKTINWQQKLSRGKTVCKILHCVKNSQYVWNSTQCVKFYTVCKAVFLRLNWYAQSESPPSSLSSFSIFFCSHHVQTNNDHAVANLLTDWKWPETEISPSFDFLLIGFLPHRISYSGMKSRAGPHFETDPLTFDCLCQTIKTANWKATDWSQSKQMKFRVSAGFVICTFGSLELHDT